MFSLTKKKFFKIFEETFLALLLFYCFLITLALNFTNTSHQQFVYLADAFLHGQLYFRELPGSYVDLAWYQGKFYWHLGPFPAILLMPFVLFWGTDFLQGYIQFFLTLLNFYLLYSIALKLGIKRKINALWLAFAYVFGTMYFTVATNSNSWYFSQVVATSLLLLAINEYIGKRRFLFIGISIALAFSTRANFILGLPFFILGIIFNIGDWRRKVTSFIYLLLPIFLVGLLLSWYNYARFNDIFEAGYLRSTINALHANELEVALTYGGGNLFSLRYIPTNIYYYFLNGPNPLLFNPSSYIIIPPFFTFDSFGSLGGRAFINVLTSAPIFLFSLLASLKEKIVLQSWISALLVLGSLLLYFAPQQRYFLDIAPFLLILLVRALAIRLSFPVKMLILISLLLNFFFIAVPYRL